MTMAAPLPGSVAVGSLAAGYKIGSVRGVELGMLAEAFVGAYGSQAFPLGTTQARTEIQQAFDGEYGELIPAASLVAAARGQVAGIVLTVRRAPWADTPSGPFIIDLLSTPGHRRRGVARHLLHQAMANAQLPDESVIGLRVEIDNTPAQHLYSSAGFHNWPPTTPSPEPPARGIASMAAGRWSLRRVTSTRRRRDRVPPHAAECAADLGVTCSVVPVDVVEELVNSGDDLAEDRDGVGERTTDVHSVVGAGNLEHVRGEPVGERTVPGRVSGAAHEQHRRGRPTQRRRDPWSAQQRRQPPTESASSPDYSSELDLMYGLRVMGVSVVAGLVAWACCGPGWRAGWPGVPRARRIWLFAGIGGVWSGCLW